MKGGCRPIAGICQYAHDERNAFAAGETYPLDDMKEPGWYQAVPWGLEIQIRE
jgi:putative ATPase